MQVQMVYVIVFKEIQVFLLCPQFIEYSWAIIFVA